MSTVLPSISVVIPVRNEAAKIRSCIDGILAQTVKVKEIVVIDSGSTDGTVDILKSYPMVKLIQIPGSEFNHGATRNLGVQQATGDLVLMTVGDARPYDDQWISNMAREFSDPQVAGVCGQQVCPHDRNYNPIDWFRPMDAESTRKRFQFQKEEFERLSPEEKKNVCGWDDVTAMYRREVLLKIPFHFTSYAEDLQWAKDALVSGYAIVYNYSARVYHYHIENADFSYKRAFTVLYYRYKAFGSLPTRQRLRLRTMGSWAKTLLGEKSASMDAKYKWFFYSYNNTRAMYKACNDFLETFESGGVAALDKMHLAVCGQPPIPVKTNA
jgi:rhamnosyltransferase